MSVTPRLSALARAAFVAAALLAPIALIGCARPIDDSTYYLGANDVPTAICRRLGGGLRAARVIGPADKAQTPPLHLQVAPARR